MLVSTRQSTSAAVSGGTPPADQRCGESTPDGRAPPVSGSRLPVTPPAPRTRCGWGSHGERSEAIVEELRVGSSGSSAAVHTVLDRRAAISTAVAAAGTRDVLLIVGRGHETTPTDDGDPVPCDDAEVAQQALDARAARAGGRTGLLTPRAGWPAAHGQAPGRDDGGVGGPPGR